MKANQRVGWAQGWQSIWCHVKRLALHFVWGQETDRNVLWLCKTYWKQQQIQQQIQRPLTRRRTSVHQKTIPCPQRPLAVPPTHFRPFANCAISKKASPSPVPLGRHIFDLILDCFDWIPREGEVEPRGGGSGSGSRDGDERAFDSALNPLRDRNVRFRGKSLNDLASLSIETNCEYSER